MRWTFPLPYTPFSIVTLTPSYSLPRPSLVSRLFSFIDGYLTPRWSRNNRYLASASLDSTIIIWDLSVLPYSYLKPLTPLTEPQNQSSNDIEAPYASCSSSRVHTVRCDAPVNTVAFHPRNGRILLVSLSVNEIYIVDLREGGGRSKLEDMGEEPEAGGEGDAEGEPDVERKR